MSEKEKIAKQMKEILEQFMSEPQLKAHMLVAIEQQTYERERFVVWTVGLFAL